MKHGLTLGCHGTAPHNSSSGSSVTKLEAARRKKATVPSGTVAGGLGNGAGELRRSEVPDQLPEITEAANTTKIAFPCFGNCIALDHVHQSPYSQHAVKLAWSNSWGGKCVKMVDGRLGLSWLGSCETCSNYCSVKGASLGAYSIQLGRRARTGETLSQERF